MKGTLISESTQKHKNIYFFSLWIFTWLKIIFTPSIIFITLKDAFKRNCYVDKPSEEIFQYSPSFLCSLLFTPCIRSFSHSIAQYFSHRVVALFCTWKGQYLFKRQLFSTLFLTYSVCGLCLPFKLASAGRSC